MSSNATISRLIRCPRCEKKTCYDLQNPYRPFCSARCKNEDIVGWAEEKYHIPTTTAAGDAEIGSHSSEEHDDDDDTNV